MKIFSNRFKPVVVGLLLATGFTSSAQADVLMLGSETEISSSIAQNFKQQVTYYTGRQDLGDVLYVNMGTISDDEFQMAKSQVLKRALVILDFSDVVSPEERASYSAQITGVGLSSRYVVSGVENNELIINGIVEDVHDVNGQPVDDASEKMKGIKNSMKHVLERFKFGEGE
ncbi:hypothetical protein L1D53_24355 [Vibrio alginolyticus]|uniref:hypothetical protein n=1 Tax=Vibrio alginolyticus TaxID=663 RepID=UPI001EFED824|nr:hypothetical protein [Vibrio alginolyticus]MCG9766626.1 hypothetical protein [Vibrio alginolyticus]